MIQWRPEPAHPALAWGQRLRTGVPANTDWPHSHAYVSRAQPPHGCERPHPPTHTLTPTHRPRTPSASPQNKQHRAEECCRRWDPHHESPNPYSAATRLWLQQPGYNAVHTDNRGELQSQRASAHRPDPAKGHPGAGLCRVQLPHNLELYSQQHSIFASHMPGVQQANSFPYPYRPPVRHGKPHTGPASQTIQGPNWGNIQM